MIMQGGRAGRPTHFGRSFYLPAGAVQLPGAVTSYTRLRVQTPLTVQVQRNYSPSRMCFIPWNLSSISE